MTSTPTIVRSNAPDLQEWKSATKGHVLFQTLIDGAAGPTSRIVQGIADIRPGEEEKAHHHDRPETVHVLSGGGRARLADREVPINAGDTLFLPERFVHAFTAGEEGLRFLYTFPADRFDEVAYDFVGE